MEQLSRKETTLITGFEETLERTRTEVMPAVQKAINTLKNVEPEMILEYTAMLQTRIIDECESLAKCSPSSRAYNNYATNIILTYNCLLGLERTTSNFIEKNDNDIAHKNK